MINKIKFNDLKDSLNLANFEFRSRPCNRNFH